MGDAVNQPASRRRGDAECRNRQTFRLSTVMIASFSGIGSLLHFGWEMAQMPLFELAGYTFSGSVDVSVCHGDGRLDVYGGDLCDARVGAP